MPIGGGVPVDPDLRVSLVVAGVAAALSLLLGAFSRVDVLPLLIRAVALGIFLGALAFGCLFLLRRFVPEIFDASSGDVPFDERGQGSGGEEGVEGSLGDEGRIGGAVDIVLGADDDDSMLSPVDGPPSGFPAMVPAARGASGGDDDLAPAELGDEVAEVPGGGDAEVTLLEEAPAGDGLPQGAAAMPSRSAIGADDLDILPDMDSVAVGFLDSGGGDSSSYSFREESTPSVSRKASGKGSDGADPAALALAVRTLLKRDQKG
jgi:hypothetical protein